MKQPKKRLSPRKIPMQSRSQETVEYILAATAHILAQEGIMGFSTNKVAKKAGVSIGSLYQFFPNKEALLSALVERRLIQDRAYFARAMADVPDNFDERLRRLILAGLELHRKDHKILKLMFDQLAVSGQLDMAQRMNGQFFEFILESLVKESGRLKKNPGLARIKAHLYAVSILGLWHSQAEKVWHDLDLEELARHTQQMILRDLRA